MDKKKTVPLKNLKLNRHFVFIEAPVEFVGPQAVLWGEADWWPKDSAMQFRRTSSGELAVGTTYDMHLVKPLKQVWQVEVTQFVPGYMVERTFRKGFFKGYELVRVEERSNGTRVDYELHYSIPSPFDMILWKLFCAKKHDANITRILSAFKEYCLRKMETDQ